MFEHYLQDLIQVMKTIECNDHTGSLSMDDGVGVVVSMLTDVKESGRKIIWVGNGGSAAITSHSAADYFRTGNIKTQCFSDASLLTCMSNDFGYPAVFAKPIELYAESGDILVAISSSGQSVNILNAVQAAKEKGCKVVTLSGFKKENPLRKLGDVNFYVLCGEYGHVELAHGVLCHSFLDLYMQGTICKEVE